MTALQPSCIETVRWCQGRYHLIGLHRQRMERTCRELYGTSCEDIGDWLAPVPENMRGMTVKCRITYDIAIRSVEFEPYTPKRVESLQLVDGGTIDYHLKFSDRTTLDLLAERRGSADAVIIVKDGLVTDTTYSNLVFQAGDKLLTPSRPLLRGVMATHLIESGRVIPADLTPDDILPGNRYGITRAYLVNAMLPLGTAPSVDILNIGRL
ncbi:MAG: aminotransferase class IV [Alistipes sp.]|nr:aminotransferase class IV [Alistipes sp.]MDE7129191.1 aminotransferase class IV [Alistipes sp.]